MNYFKSDSAIITDCEIGKDVKVWNYVNLYGCTIGEKSTIGSYTEIQSGVIIGKNVTISSHSFICSLVKIEDDVFVGHGVMTINDITPPSFRRTGSKKGWRPTHIQKGVIIGSNATLFPINIGENSIIGAGSVVRKDVPPNVKVAGNPARII